MSDKASSARMLQLQNVHAHQIADLHDEAFVSEHVAVKELLQHKVGEYYALFLNLRIYAENELVYDASEYFVGRLTLIDHLIQAENPLDYFSEVFLRCKQGRSLKAIAQEAHDLVQFRQSFFLLQIGRHEVMERLLEVFLPIYSCFFEHFNG